MQDFRSYAREHLEKFRGIKLLVLDADGIMTPAQVHYRDQSIEVGVSYNVLDGYALKRMNPEHIRLAIVSGRANKALQNRYRVLELDKNCDFVMGCHDKGTAVKELAQKYGLTLDQIAFMGDDFIDISAFKVAGLSISVPNRHPMVDAYVNYVTLNEGGFGAVREVCDLLCIANEQPYNLMSAELKAWWSGSQTK